MGAMENGVLSPVCGLVDLSTPTWRKISEQPDTPRHAESSASDVLPVEKSEPSSADLVGGLRSLRQAVSEDRYRSYEAILGWFNGLLRSTMTEDRDPHRKSLLGLCMRKIPACIANIEAYERQAARERGCQTMWDASNVSFDLYEQLEALGFPGLGWRPMKLTVRAHAMTLLTEAVSEGLLEPEYVRLLVRLCLQLSCTTEAGKLAASVEMSLPVSRSLLSSLTESRQLLPLREMLQSFRGRNTPAVPLQWLLPLFKRGVLPATCLSTPVFSTLLKSSLEFITTNRLGFSVAAFLSTCLPLLAMASLDEATSQQGNTEQALISLVAGVVAAATAMTGARDFVKTQKRRRAWRRVFFILDHCLTEVRRPRRRRRFGRDNGVFIFALARHLMAAKSPFAGRVFQRQVAAELKDVAHAAESAATLRLYYCQATTLLCWLAQYRSKSCAVSMRESVTELCSKLDGLDLGDCFGSGLRTDVAFVLAQKTKDLRDLAFAESLRGAAGSSRVSTMFSGWHWEEGISEWVQPDQGAGDTAKQGGMTRPKAGETTGQPSTTVMAVGATRKATSQRTQRGDDMCHLALTKGSQPAAWSSSRLARTRPRSVGRPRPVLGSDDWDDLV